MKKATLVLSLAIVLVLAMGAMAYALTSSVTITAAVPNVFTLTVTQPAVAFGTLTDPQLTAGKTVASATDVLVKSNKVYTLSNAVSDFSDGGVLTMPASVLTYAWTGSTSGSGTGANADQNITNAGARGNTNYLMGYTLTPTLAAEPAAYSTTVVYTAVQN